MTAEILLAKWKKTKSVQEEMLFPSFIRGITNIENKQTGDYKILVVSLLVFARMTRGDVLDLLEMCETMRC